MVDNVAVVDRGTESPASLLRKTSTRNRIANTNIYSVNVTDRFLHAASKLQRGTLIKDEYFTPFEAVGALEIGDPKMDSGCLIDGEDPDAEFDVTQSLLPSQILWLMDELLGREVAWQTGYPLSQTIFTSYHIDSLLWPDPLLLSEAQFGRQSIGSTDDPLLHVFFRAYCLGIIKCCDLVLSMVTSQHYYEEEDFATQLFNRELLRRFSTESVIEIMRKAVNWLSSAIFEDDVRFDLSSMMEFRIELLSTLSTHAARPPSPGSITCAHLAAIKGQQSSRSAVDGAFSPRLQRRLASNVPPRPMVSVEENKVFEFWDLAIQNYLSAFSVATTQHALDLDTSFVTFNSRDPQPNVYVRALVQSFLAQNNMLFGRHNMADFIWADLRCTTLPSSPLQVACITSDQARMSTERIMVQHIDSFVQKIERSYSNIFRTLCLNRSRLRRSVCHALLEWDQIQAEAEELDEELQKLSDETAQVQTAGSAPSFSYPISSWVYHSKLGQLRLILELGFELSIYAPHEMAGMYWYLAHICDTHLTHLERISYFVSIQEQKLSSSTEKSETHTMALQECQIAIKTLYRHYGRLKATEAFARCLHVLYGVLGRNGHFAKSSQTYSSDSWRYEARMRPFLHLSIPEPLSFALFEFSSQVDGKSDATMLAEASDYAQAAKRAWDEVLRAGWHAFPLNSDAAGDSATIETLWTKNARDILRATIATSIVIDQLRKRLVSPASTDALKDLVVAIPSKGDRNYWHPFWIVPAVSQ